MASYRFLHAADLHLDSPLLGLRGKSETWATKVERASREAFDNLVALAKSESCRFVVLAGDVFDGALRNYQTALYFMAGMRVLGEAGIEVFVILGNHDAENQFASQLPLAQNVRVFPSAKAASFALDDIDVTVHGQSFAQRDVTDNLARAYPQPHPNRFNIGVLHTACQGSSKHALYAPCSVEQLVNHGYDYWALGHVHTRAVLHEHPHIVYPGNLQGRNPRETGSKGASVVHVDDGRVQRVVHHDLDVVRWEEARVDVTGVDSLDEVIECVRAQMRPALALARDKAVALRVVLSGPTPMHTQLQLHKDDVRQRVQTQLLSVSANLWLERVRVATTPKAADEGALDPTVTGELSRLVAQALEDGTAQSLIDARLRELRAKLPAAADAEELTQRLRMQSTEAAAALAFALLDDRGAGTDAAV